MPFLPYRLYLAWFISKTRLAFLFDLCPFGQTVICYPWVALWFKIWSWSAMIHQQPWSIHWNMDRSPLSLSVKKTVFSLNPKPQLNLSNNIYYKCNTFKCITLRLLKFKIVREITGHPVSDIVLEIVRPLSLIKRGWSDSPVILHEWEKTRGCSCPVIMCGVT